MMVLRKRCNALHRLADQLEQAGPELAQALSADLDLSLRHLTNREIPAGLYALRRYRPSGLFPADPSLEIGARVGIGTVGILVPEASPVSTLARTVAAAIMAGNQEIRVCLPPSLETSAPLLISALKATLPPVTVVQEDPDSFVRHALDDPYLQVVFCVGEASWIGMYREPAYQTRTKIIFEGRGNDPFLVFPEANPVEAANAAMAAAATNAGLDPAAPKRFYVADSIHDAFVEALVRAGGRLRTGLASLESTDVGPVAHARGLQRLRVLLQDALERGAEIRCGGEFEDHEGNRYPSLAPTVLTGCTPDMPIVREPCVGPILCVLPFEDETQAIRLAEGPLNGFCASVWNAPDQVVTRLSRSFGHVFRNSTVFDPQHADARLEWGGYGRSSWVWDWEGERLVQRTGPRLLAIEFSRTLHGVA